VPAAPVVPALPVVPPRAPASLPPLPLPPSKSSSSLFAHPKNATSAIAPLQRGAHEITDTRDLAAVLMAAI